MQEDSRRPTSGFRITLRTALISAVTVAVVGFLFIHDYRGGGYRAPGFVWNIMHAEIVFTSPCQNMIDISALPPAKQTSATGLRSSPPPPPPGFKIVSGTDTPPPDLVSPPDLPTQDVTMPDGTIIDNVPVGTTQRELAERYENWKANHAYERYVCGWEIPYRWLLAALTLFVAGVAFASRSKP